MAAAPLQANAPATRGGTGQIVARTPLCWTVAVRAKILLALKISLRWAASLSAACLTLAMDMAGAEPQESVLVIPAGELLANRTKWTQAAASNATCLRHAVEMDDAGVLGRVSAILDGVEVDAIFVTRAVEMVCVGRQKNVTTEILIQKTDARTTAEWSAGTHARAGVRGARRTHARRRAGTG